LGVGWQRAAEIGPALEGRVFTSLGFQPQAATRRPAVIRAGGWNAVRVGGPCPVPPRPGMNARATWETKSRL